MAKQKESAEKSKPQTSRPAVRFPSWRQTPSWA